jgi:periplasmic protein TonB
VIRPARWLPLSLALHAATLGGGVWLARELGERALFVDLTLNEPDEHAGAAPSGGAARAAAPARRGASQVARPGPASSPARPAGGAGPSPPVTAATPDVASPPPAATPSAVSPTPIVEPAPTVEPPPIPPAPPVEPSRTVEPTPAVEPSRTVEPAPTVEPSRTVEPAPAVEPSRTVTHPAVGHTGIAGAAPSASGASAGSGSVRAHSGDIRGAGSGAAAEGAPGGRGAEDGQLALAIPGAGGAEMYGPYLAALRRRLQETLEYPAAARRRGVSGTVHLEIALESTGRVSDVLLVRSSSHAMLDDAALQAARNLRRVPFPPDVRPRALRVRLPVVFELR